MLLFSFYEDQPAEQVGASLGLSEGNVRVIRHRALELRSRGLRLREYRVVRNGSVNWSVGPEDQVLLSRLQAPLEGVARIDAILLYEGEHRFEDIPFDAAAGEVVLAPCIERVRAMPTHREVIRLVAVEAGGDRVLGEYTFNHSR